MATPISGVNVKRTPAVPEGTKNGGRLVWLKVSSLVPHPLSPRIFLHEEVVAYIAEQSRAGLFREEHALLVRPLGDDRYQIIDGRQRHAGAQRADLTEIPCWVREMTDEEAYMALLSTNLGARYRSQLSPVEIGIHALVYVESGVGGRGKKGGLRAYARSVGLDHAYVLQLRKAAEVYRRLESGDPGHQYLKKARHLAEIHAAPQEEWPSLAADLLEDKWNVAETRREVKRLREQLGSEAGSARAKKVARDAAGTPAVAQCAGGTVLHGDGFKVGPDRGTVDLILLRPPMGHSQAPTTLLKDCFWRISELLREGGSYYVVVPVEYVAVARRAAYKNGLRLGGEVFCARERRRRRLRTPWAATAEVRVYGTKLGKEATWNVKAGARNPLSETGVAKPLACFIEASSSAGDLICNFLASSKAVAAAAMQLKRKYVLVFEQRATFDKVCAELADLAKPAAPAKEDAQPAQPAALSSNEGEGEREVKKNAGA